MFLIRSTRQGDRPTRRSRALLPALEDCESRKLLSGIVGQHIGVVADGIQGAHIGMTAGIQGAHIGMTAGIQGQHIGVTTDGIQGAHIGGNAAESLPKSQIIVVLAEDVSMRKH